MRRMPIKRVGRTCILVHDLNEAYRFYTEKLGFTTIYKQGTFVHVGPEDHPGVGVWFLEACTEEQKALVGKQTGGEPVMVVYTDDCRATYRELSERGVHFEFEPKESPEDVVTFFHDLYGNRIVLVELKGSALPG